MRCNLFLPIFFFSLIGSLDAPAQEMLVKDWNPLDEFVDSLLDIYHAAGLSLGIVQGERVIYSKGYGYRDYENRIPVDTHTLFQLGSCTKAFTATLLGKLEAQGKLSFTDHPSKFLPELKFYNEAMDKEICIDHLLSHSTGLSNLATESCLVLFPPDSSKELIDRIKFLKPRAGVGETFMYTNLGYYLAALIAEEIEDNSWSEQVRQNIFAEVGMWDSHPTYEEAMQEANFAQGYSVIDNMPVKALPERITARNPAGSIFSSIHDISKWLRIWLNNGRYQGRQILPAKSLEKAWTIQQSLTNADTINQGYGFGWFIEDFHGERKIHHSGGISGYTSNVVFFPESNIAFAILTNQSNSSLAYTVTERIEQIIFNLKQSVSLPEVLSGPGVQIENPESELHIDSEDQPEFPLESIIGTYSHPGFGEFQLIQKHGNYFAQFPFTTFRLDHREGNRFGTQFAEMIPAIMTSPFLLFDFQSKDGEVYAVSINVDVEPVRFLKKIVDSEYSIGTLDFIWEDSTRVDSYYGGHRVINARVWYPSNPAIKLYNRSPYYLFADKIPTNEFFHLNAEMHNSPTHAYYPAPIDTNQILPLLIFSPSLGGHLSHYTFYAEHFAKKGYMVMGINHMYESELVYTPDGKWVLSNETFHDSLKQLKIPEEITADEYRAVKGIRQKVLGEDIIYGLNRLLKESSLKSIIDTSQIACFGHSIGGAGAIYASMLDDRIKAVIDLDGTPPSVAMEQGIDVPFLFLEDLTDYQNHSGYAKLHQRRNAFCKKNRADAFRILINGIHHNSFLDNPLYFSNSETERNLSFQVLGQITAYMDEFLHHYLNHQSWVLKPTITDSVHIYSFRQ